MMKVFTVVLYVLLSGCMTADNTKCIDGKTYQKIAAVWHLQSSLAECLSDKEIKSLRNEP